MKRSLPIVPFFLLALHLSCDFQRITDNDPPKWYIDLTIPLLDADYALAGIANDSTIHSDTLDGSLSIKFDGELPRESIDGEYLKVPGLEDPITEEKKIDVQNSEQIFEYLN